MHYDSVFNKLHYVPSGAKPVCAERYNRVAALCAGTKMRARRAAEKQEEMRWMHIANGCDFFPFACCGSRKILCRL
jgi:hypothetical protein